MSRWGNNAETHPRMIAARIRQNEAVKLKIAGATFDQIAERLGYANRAAARAAVLAALERWGTEAAEDLRRIEALRLEQITLQLWQEIQKGDLDAINTYLKVAARRARLLGLDAPTRVITEDAIDAEIRRLEEELRGRGAPVRKAPAPPPATG